MIPSDDNDSPWRFWIDRGGTFTDCLGISPEGSVFSTKVLSSDSAPLEAIEQILGRVGARREDLSHAEVKLGTTVATNALLERRGVETALVTNAGMSGVFDIGTQERPDLFALEITRPERLHRFRIETTGRRNAEGECVDAFDEEALRHQLVVARDGGARAAAIVLMHAYLEPADESRIAALAREVGFEHVVCSHELSREIGFLSRGETAIADAYLTPLLRGHVESLEAGLPRAQLSFMQSSGGLTDGAHFRGPNALLSGPAGGVVAAQFVAAQSGFDRVIGFDMGGTSTDVCLVEGEQLDRAFESEVGGVRVKAPMLAIHTVAAGGGSLCRFDGIRLTVGPESAGSDPGPLCYDLRDEAGAPKATELALTDVNLALGRVASDRFPFALSREPVDRGLLRIAEELARGGFDRSADEIAAGFFEIANAAMAQAILEVSVERGADPRDHVLVGFGGAGGQHVCALAARLGIRKILLHPHAGLLSAVGIGIAPVSWDGERDGQGRRLPEAGALDPSIESDWQALAEEGAASIGPSPSPRTRERSLDLRYAGTDTALSVPAPNPPRASGGAASASEPGTAIADWRLAFESAHRKRFGYVREGRAIEIAAVRLRMAESPTEAQLAAANTARAAGEASADEGGAGDPVPLRTSNAWFPVIGRVEAPVYEREDLQPGHSLEGPALILESTGTVVIDPGFSLSVDAHQVFHLTSTLEKNHARRADLDEADPVRLEVLGNRLMSIAEQMGAVLRNTSVSTNIKERLDYSCAVFDAEGGLVANAPHIPVHLGAMSDTVDAVRARFEPIPPGEVYVTNDPFAGGSHLPDVTVVTPVFLAGRETASFFVASRGHHADLGGKTPGSMPPDSETLAEEGILIDAFPLVRAGRFDEARIREVLGAGPWPARRPDDNVADLEAKVAANRAGEKLLIGLVEEVGEETVRVTMEQLQAAAARKVARELARFPAGEYRFDDALDDGTPICVRLSIEHGSPEGALDGPDFSDSSEAYPARMTIDFAGTGAAVRGNLNAPSAVARAAIIYVLRSLVEERIPLNGGCLLPVEVRLPEGSLLDPPRGVAVVGGNVETSQRIVDVLLGALGRAAASQGTMNNVTFGDDAFGYYETIGGGAGATARAPGASAVHTHMTNTRITDPEVLEARFPVALRVFGPRSGSGGAGRNAGGEGITRHYRFLRPVAVSLLTERRRRTPFGLEGGHAGMPGRNRVYRARTQHAEEVPGHARLMLDAGDELWIDTPGGGGFGSVAGEAQADSDSKREGY